MFVKHPYSWRIRLARTVFWIVSVMLVNLWVDVNDWDFDSHKRVADQQFAWFDDYDSLYEWVAESLLDYEDAIPEEREGADHSSFGKWMALKAWWQSAPTAGHVLPGICLRKTFQPYRLPFWQSPLARHWSPPPEMSV